VSSLAVAALVLFATGAFGGFFVTVFWIPAPEDWWWPALVRVLWQLGGAALLGLLIAIGVGSPRRGNFWAILAGFAAVGGVLCVNPLLDLARGPARMQGHAEVHISRGKSIFATVEVRRADGAVDSLAMSGWPVNAVQDRLEACDGSEAIDLLALRHLGVVLAVECTPRPP
jgi:hypothetical protein